MEGTYWWWLDQSHALHGHQNDKGMQHLGLGFGAEGLFDEPVRNFQGPALHGFWTDSGPGNQCIHWPVL